MARLPDKTSLGNSPDLQPRSRVPDIPLGALGAIGEAGAAWASAGAKVGQGIAALGAGIGQMGERQSQQENAVAGIEAQTDYLTGTHALRKELQDDPDYQSTPQKFDEKIGGIIDNAASKIPDPQKRELWVARQKLESTRERLQIEEYVGRRISTEKLTGIEENLARQQSIYIDSNSSEEARAAAGKAMRESIDLAMRSGIVDPFKAKQWGQKFLSGAQWNEGATRVESDPAGLIKDLQPIAPAQAAPGAAQAPAAATPPRDYGKMELPITVPAMVKGMAIERIKQGGVFEQFPKELQQKLTKAAEGSGDLTLTKADLDSIPHGPWKSIAKEMGLPEPKDPPAAKASARGAQGAPEAQAAVVQTAQNLGISPRDLAAVISYETGGKFDPDIMGGKGGRYMGLIQFGPEERQKYGVRPGMSFAEQMGAVEGYLRDRGLKPGSSLSDIYRTVNGGNPNASLNASDGNGTIGQHIEKIAQSHYGNADKFLSDAQGRPIAVPTYDPRYSELTPIQRQTLITRAEKALRSQDVQQTAAVERLATDDINSLRSTGQGVTTLDPVVAERAMGPAKFAKYQEARTLAHDAWRATNDMPLLSNEEIGARMKSLDPSAGAAEGFTRRSAVYAEASKEAERILKLRSQDPAQAAMDVPAVATAYKAAETDPSLRKNAIDLNLAAQGKFGIPEEQRTPVTGAEAAQLGAPLQHMLPGTERAALRNVAQAIQERYPEHADKVFEQVVRGLKFREEVGRAAARVLRTLSNGELPTRAETQAAEQEREIGAANRAIAAPAAPTGTPARDEPNYASDLERSLSTMQPGLGMAGGAKDEAFANVPVRAIQMLRSNPALAEQFDAKFGKGTAKKVLELGVK